jgi:hypothetical protein
LNRVKLTLKAGVVAVGVLGSQIAVAVPSVADTADDPCGLAVSYLCRFMPIAPDLDGDVDLTTPLPPTGDVVPARDSPPPAGVASAGMPLAQGTPATAGRVVVWAIARQVR